MEVCEIIKEIRINNTLSQEKLAKILDVSQKAISNWESNNDKPKYDSILAIYKNFNITPNELFGIESLQNLQTPKPEYQTLYESLPMPQQAEVRGYMKRILQENKTINID